jgi:hypothetical protein
MRREELLFTALVPLTFYLMPLVILARAALGDTKAGQRRDLLHWIGLMTSLTASLLPAIWLIWAWILIVPR